MTEPVLSNGWREGSAAGGALGSRAGRWALRTVEPGVEPLAPGEHDAWDWGHEKVGWGLVLPFRPGGATSSADLAAAKDAPEALQHLVAHRKEAPVLRWHAADPDVLLRHYPGFAEPERIPVGGSPRGVGPGAIPSFLMLWGDLSELPWRLQYSLNLDPRIFAGRLPLTGAALDRYAGLLTGAWHEPEPSQARAVVWATDHGAGDMSQLMRVVVAEPVHERYAGDADITVTRLAGPDATAPNLVTTLTAERPDVVVSTSHGFTGPAGAPDLSRLGWLVGTDHDLVDPTALLAGWQPRGAVWYAHACCGAGSVDPSDYAGLFDPGSALDVMTAEIATLGSTVAPLPAALLAAEEPLRAFVGHVEPTFDWTIRDPSSRHALTADLVTALYDELMLGRPVGWALAAFHGRAGAEAAALDDARVRVLRNEAEPGAALTPRLRFLDRRGLVVLGDPAVALPSTAGSGPREPD